MNAGHVGYFGGVLAAGGETVRGQRVHDAGQEDHGHHGPQDARCGVGVWVGVDGVGWNNASLGGWYPKFSARLLPL